MNLDQITTKCWILALFIRDDGERLLLGDGYFDFKDSLQHFQPNTFANDIVELQGTDGQVLAGQVRRGASQSFDGYIGDAITPRATIEARRREFLMFFRKKHFYKVIYIFPDGSAIQRKQGYITDAPAVPEIRQKFPTYHVALNFEDLNYYEYAENTQGEEIYKHSQNVIVSTAMSGGLVWDEKGAVSDANGFVWENGGTGGATIITIDAIDNVYPIWTVAGPATNPTLTNTTTRQTISWQGTVPAGQTLVINMNDKTATMAGANVFAFISGDWLYLAPGANTLSYSVLGTADASTLSWNNIVG